MSGEERVAAGSKVHVVIFQRPLKVCSATWEVVVTTRWPGLSQRDNSRRFSTLCPGRGMIEGLAVQSSDPARADHVRRWPARPGWSFTGHAMSARNRSVIGIVVATLVIGLAV